MLESSDKVKVDYLKKQEDEVFQMIFFEEGVSTFISSKDIIGEGEVNVYEKRLKKKGPAVTCYELKSTSYLQLKKIAANFSGKIMQEIIY